MFLTQREAEKLQIMTLAMVAERRRKRGLKLNHPESAAVICDAVLEGAREGMTVEQAIQAGSSAITAEEVMEGVVDLIPFIQVEAVFTDGSRLVTVHNPIR